MDLRVKRLGVVALGVSLGLAVAGGSAFEARAQSGAAKLEPPAREASSIALPIAEDRGAAAFEQALRRLGTTASVMAIVAHPDDEDGPLLTYLTRGLGVRAVLFTLTRGEGGQNAMGGETYDALGLIRTNELLKADEFYGTKQLWGTEADFGFSKTQEEAFARWGHERVLYDAVLAVRRERPQVIVSTFVGGVTDGHGQHQVSGEIAQEVFTAAADAKVFPDQLKPVSEGGLGLQPWQPLAVYSMVPFARVTDKGMFDYATGKWAPARFKNYVTGEWTEGVLKADVKLEVGTRDATLGRSYLQIAREGWGEQKSQYGGASPALSGPATTSYHLWAVVPAAGPKPHTNGSNNDLFVNDKVAIPTGIAGLTYLVDGAVPGWLTEGLGRIQDELRKFGIERTVVPGFEAAHELAPIYKQTLELRARVAGASELSAKAKYGLLFELDSKISDFQVALKEALGLDLIGFRSGTNGGGGRGASVDESASSVAPEQEFRVNVHVAQANAASSLTKVWLESRTGDAWTAEQITGEPDAKAAVADVGFRVKAAANAQPTAPYFTRPTIEQPYYDVSNPAWRGRSLAPWPLEAWAEFTFEGVPIRLGMVVETLQRITGPGGVYQPLVVTPAVGVRVEPDARILPLDGSALPVRVTVHTEGAAEGTVELKLPKGWHAEPAQAEFKRAAAGDAEPMLFSVTPAAVAAGAYTIGAVAHAGGHDYAMGWTSVGYQGLQPYNQYKDAALGTRKVDVKLAPGLRVGYVMGTGDKVPQAIAEMGVEPHLLSAAEIESGDLAQFNVIVIGIRAYSNRPELSGAEARLNEFVRNGGTLIVEYQSATFPAPLPLHMGGRPEVVVDEQAPVKLLQPDNALLTTPNRITAADFDGWVEERGHSFADSWDPGYTALTETADAGQDPQRGGLLVAHVGKGTYIYVAYALYRQLPELVPGSYRILANLLSAGAAKRP